MAEEKRMDGKICVITGGGSGIGAATGKRFAKEGAKVALFDLHLDAAKAVADEIRGDGGEALAFEVDVRQKDSIFAAGEAVLKEWGAPDVWMNSAGVSYILPFLECSEEVWDLTLDINLKGCFFACQCAVTHMRQKGGSIINLSSLSGKKATDQYQAYCASKSGVIMMTQSIALEFAGNNIRANTICPGIVETPMWDQQKIDYAKKRGIKPEEVMPRFKSTIPLERLCFYEDVTNTAVYLATEESSYLTGQSIMLAGGAYMD